MIPAERAHLRVAARSHPGMSGKNNEDRYAVSTYRLSAENPTPSIFAIVADGIGGHHAGEVAAEMAVETISQHIAESNASKPIHILKEAIIQASQRINAQSNENPEYEGMGSTCACSWVIDDRLYIASVGDSRIYLLRDDQIIQMTTDHTWVQDAIEAGILSIEEARRHPNAHVIRRFLGSMLPVEPDVRLRLSPTDDRAQAEANQGVQLLPGDQVLLCSDGLTDLVPDEEILSTVRSQPQEEAIQALINLANQRGGHDNISIALLQSPPLAPQPAPVASPRDRNQNLKLALLASALLVVLAAALIGGLSITRRVLADPTPTPTAAKILPLPLQQSQTAPGNAPQPSDTKPAIEATQPLDKPTLTSWPTNTPSGSSP